MKFLKQMLSRTTEQVVDESLGVVRAVKYFVYGTLMIITVVAITMIALAIIS